MPKILFKNSKGRNSAVASPAKSKRPGKPSVGTPQARRGGGKTVAGKSSRVAPKYKKASTRKLSVTSTEESDDLSDPPDDEDEEEASDSDGDESDVSAPSYSPRMNRKTGGKAPKKASKKAPKKEPKTEVKPDPYLYDTDDENKAFFADDDSDDDVIYGAVDEISDEEQQEDLPEAELEDLEEQVFEQELNIREDIAATFLGDIDGYSGYGFDDELDRDQFSSSSDSSDEADLQRHVHFAEADHIPASMNPSSPILEMKPLRHSSTMQGFSHEELQQTPKAGEISADHRAFFGDPDEDSDLTDDDLPAEAHTAPSALQQDPLPFSDAPDSTFSTPKKKDKKSPPRGPVRGVFKFDGDKPWAVLDPSGKKITFCPPPNTNRHEWLERKGIDDAFGIGSAQSSPRASFATLLDDSDRSVTSSQENVELLMGGANVMMSGLNSFESSTGGRATGPPEAFFAPADPQMFGDYLIDPEDFDQDEDDIDDPTGEGRLNIEDMITFGDDSDDESELPASPAFSSVELASTPASKRTDNYSHLHSGNIMSFRRGAEPASASQQRVWDFDSTPSSSKFKVPSSPITRKRKARSPPYQGDHYKGVTAVERSIVTPKRRRGNTMN